MLGDCWADLCDDERAMTAYQRYAQLHPEQPQGWLGICRLKLLRHDFAAAKQVCDANWRQYPQHSYSEQMVALVAFFSRRWQEAETLYQNLLASDPTGGGRFYGAISYKSALARIRLQKNDHQGATSLLASARADEEVILRDAPHDTEALYRLAAINSCQANEQVALGELASACGQGWIDYRSAQLDPRFDGISGNPQFNDLLQMLAKNVADLRQTTIARNPAAEKR